MPRPVSGHTPRESASSTCDCRGESDVFECLRSELKALDMKPGDEVVVTLRSFMASASCVDSVRAIPVFADVDRGTQKSVGGDCGAHCYASDQGDYPIPLGGNAVRYGPAS